MKNVQYFNFADALGALKFYEENFGATEVETALASDPMFKENLDQMGMTEEEAETFVMNASFKILDQPFMVSSTWGQKEIDNSGAINVFTFDSSNEAEVQTITDFYNKAVEAGFEVTMELGPTEWSSHFGGVKDPYGVEWMFNGE
ncbi:VOC family protein [Jeotgalicoccus huakuii]|uniref:VOC family protein n=1 Tax=Jeotgalicoccus sp. ATCC 8456 TaxID=946435 RepID=UPI0018E5C989|nr:VOC family protein [Jeotgalicoccus sp. ATCC 8456]MCK1977631.1 VOC family protein [Jeotgalicoccus huakuii]QQD86142.1 VOC family protein [Jeotgalicoccus sp. ATCC 8456]